MSVGLQEAARRAHRKFDVRLAVDSDPAAARTYKRNFPRANVIASSVESLFDGEIGTELTALEEGLAEQVGRVDILIGGPPCQGHSDLNNHTRREDPRNHLYALMARGAEVLWPKLVVIENVAPVQWDREGVVEATSEALREAGYTVDSDVIDLRRIGIPQLRRRHLLIASRSKAVDPTRVICALHRGLDDHPDRTVRWAMDDLKALRSRGVFDSAGRTSDENARRIHYLFSHNVYDLPNHRRPKCHHDNGHSYISMYGRLRWDRPAQTITTGFGSMGQGRYVHPSERRTITPHEAARLQSLPDWFDFGDDPGRGELARMIGNAVPPLLMVELGQQTIGRLLGSSNGQEVARRRR